MVMVIPRPGGARERGIAVCVCIWRERAASIPSREKILAGN